MLRLLMSSSGLRRTPHACEQAALVAAGMRASAKLPVAASGCFQYSRWQHSQASDKPANAAAAAAPKMSHQPNGSAASQVGEPPRSFAASAAGTAVSPPESVGGRMVEGAAPASMNSDDTLTPASPTGAAASLQGKSSSSTGSGSSSSSSSAAEAPDGIAAMDSRPSVAERRDNAHADPDVATVSYTALHPGAEEVVEGQPTAVYKSATDDIFGVQKNWFSSVFKQINYLAKTGSVPALVGRQRAVFEAIEREFEALYAKHIHNRGLDSVTHRSTLLVCLSIATYRVLTFEVANEAMVLEVIRTNLGSIMLNILKPLHKFRLWLLLRLLVQDPVHQALQLLPALQADMGGMCESSVEQEEPTAAAVAAAAAGGGGATQKEAAHVFRISRCSFHEILSQEDADFLLPEFCCRHGMMWLSAFRKYGVDVRLDQSFEWGDSCCALRIARAPAGGH